MDQDTEESRRVFAGYWGEKITAQNPDPSRLDWPDWTVGLGPDWTGLLNQWSSPKIKDRTIKQSSFLIQTGLKLL